MKIFKNRNENGLRTGTVRNGNGDERERSVMARERERSGTEWNGNGMERERGTPRERKN